MNSESHAPENEAAPDADTQPQAADAARPDESLDLQAEAAKYKDLALRAQAELDNYRKRAAREKDDAIRYANTSLLEKLIPVLDNFELGLEAAKTAPDAASIALGMSMVHRQLQDFLSSLGVEAVATDGVAFDPNLHEAVAHEAHTEVPEGHVIRQLRRGYKLKDRLLRASTVTVSKGPA